MNAPAFRILGLLACLSLGAWALPTVATAQDAALIARMKERLAPIDGLLKAELVGENNQGLLSERGALQPEQKALLAAENADRTAIYAALAQKTGQSVEVIARSRAAQIRDRATEGIWLQDGEGRWYQK